MRSRSKVWILVTTLVVFVVLATLSVVLSAAPKAHADQDIDNCDVVWTSEVGLSGAPISYTGYVSTETCVRVQIGPDQVAVIGMGPIATLVDDTAWPNSRVVYTTTESISAWEGPAVLVVHANWGAVRIVSKEFAQCEFANWFIQEPGFNRRRILDAWKGKTPKCAQACFGSFLPLITSNP